MNVSLTILVVFESEGLEKTYIDFANNTILIDTSIKNIYFIIYGEFDLFIKYLTSMTLLKYDDVNLKVT